jgi:hypothetical protein
LPEASDVTASASPNLIAAPAIGVRDPAATICPLTAQLVGAGGGAGAAGAGVVGWVGVAGGALVPHPTRITAASTNALRMPYLIR